MTNDLVPGAAGEQCHWRLGGASGLGLAALAVVLVTACEFTETVKSCASGPGLTAAGVSGAALPDNQLALTFDGGPGEGTGPLGNFLYASGVQAAFFVGGAAAAADGATLATLKSQGHLIGNHTYAETPFSANSDPVATVRKTDEVLLPYVTGNMFLLRAPGGGMTESLAQRLNDSGLTRYVGSVTWDIGETTPGLTTDADCWAGGVSAQDCAGGYLAAIQVAKHGIIQLHGQLAQTADLVKVLLPQLKAAGYQLVRLDAVPGVSEALTQSGGQVGMVGGAPGCNEY